MIELALRIPIFIASPTDVKQERDIVEQEIARISKLSIEKRLLLEPIRWEKDARPGWGRPQDLLNPKVRGAELVIVILWSRMGSAASTRSDETGTMEEFRIASEYVGLGRSDDVFVYFRDTPPPSSASPHSMQRVGEFKESLHRSKSILTCDYADPNEFRETFRRHLEAWLERWSRIPEICEYALRQSAPAHHKSLTGENMLAIYHRVFDETQAPELSARLGRLAVNRYQRNGGPRASSLAISPDTLGDPSSWAIHASTQPEVVLNMLADAGQPVPPLRRESNDSVYFATPQWFYFFCAIGLIDAICRADMTAVALVPYVNPVHQVFSALAVTRRERIIEVLGMWLANRDGTTTSQPIVRNFSAYVLGMLGAIEAQDLLAEAAQYDEGSGVQLYCITSLGKLRARRHLALLAKLFFQVAEDYTRLVTAQAICRITGVARYEL